MSRARVRRGAAGESLAAAWYEARGWTVVDRNWRCRDGELDLVLRRGGTTVFCEVKHRRSTAFGSPAEAVTPLKQRRIRRLAARWLAEHPDGRGDVRFDVVAVLDGRVDVLEAAF